MIFVAIACRYQLMCLCWGTQRQRPSMAQVNQLLNCIYDNREMRDGADFDARWNGILPLKASDSALAATLMQVNEKCNLSAGNGWSFRFLKG